MDFDSDYIFPRRSRKSMAKPAGELLPGTIDENILKAPKWFDTHCNGNKNYEVICVGDVVSEAFIRNSELSHHLKMCIVDGKTKRETYNIDPGKVLPNTVKINNPAGRISGKASKKLQEILSSDEKYFVKVSGEEDALVIPAVIFAKLGTFVVYGQPPITDLEAKIPYGMVIIIVDQIYKDRMNLILNSFDIEKIQRK